MLMPAFAPREEADVANKPAPKPQPKGPVRDAGTGRYVPKREAIRRPNETVTESPPKKK